MNMCMYVMKHFAEHLELTQHCQPIYSNKIEVKKICPGRYGSLPLPGLLGCFSNLYIEAALQGPRLMLSLSNLVHTHTWLLPLFEYQALQPEGLTSPGPSAHSPISSSLTNPAPAPSSLLISSTCYS